MEAVAKAKFMRTSPRRIRQVADMVRGQSVDSALAILFGLKSGKKGARIVDKVLKSAVANWQNKEDASRSKSLLVKTIMVDEGPMMKRIRPRAQGRAFRVQKKFSHLTVVVSD